MRQGSGRSPDEMPAVTVVGAGVAGLACAVALAERGAAVEVIERADRLGGRACSWLAGGMLAPWCEAATSEPEVAARGAPSIAWWRERFAGTAAHGTLVVAPPRDAAALETLARRAEECRRLDADGVAALEPGLAGRFGRALYFPGEAHLDPRAALAALADRLVALGGGIRLGVEETPVECGTVIDCRGFAARNDLPGLRGVKGEMLVLRTDEVRLSRPVRLLHPRMPLYVVPRGGGRFMVGATMIESDDRRRVTARSVMELLGAAYALHPAFADAEIVETGTDVRPAFADNLPRVVRRDGRIHVNGLYRHGFLLAPALAREVADLVMGAQPEETDGHPGERRADARGGHDDRSHPGRAGLSRDDGGDGAERQLRAGAGAAGGRSRAGRPAGGAGAAAGRMT